MRIPAKKVPLSCCAGILPTSSPGSRDHLDVLWGQSCVSLGMKKGGPGGQSREPAGHQGSDWEELGDALSGYPVPALRPWSFEVSLLHLLPLLSHLPGEDFLSWGQGGDG